MFLADLTNILKKSINTFQLENLSISKFKSVLENMIKSIKVLSIILLCKFNIVKNNSN